jgi:hypothetical protein
MNTEKKNRKPWWALAAVLVFIYFWPAARRSFNDAASYRDQGQGMDFRNPNLRLPARQPAPTPNLPAPAALTPIPDGLTGVWAGQQAQNTQEWCALNLEMRDKQAGEMAGFVKLICYPLPTYYLGKTKIDRSIAYLKTMTPLSAILTGTMKNGAIAFRVDKTIGTAPDGCNLTGFTVTPFGSGEVAVDWQKGACPGGQMTLRKEHA